MFPGGCIAITVLLSHVRMYVSLSRYGTRESYWEQPENIMTGFCSLVTFRYNMTGYVESLPAIPPPDSRFFSSCTKFQGRDGQVGRNVKDLFMAYALQWSMDKVL